jgi:hypothetical protein
MYTTTYFYHCKFINRFCLLPLQLCRSYPDRKYPSYAAAKAAINQFIYSILSLGKIEGKIMALVLGTVGGNE